MQTKKTTARNAHINAYKKDRAFVSAKAFFGVTLLVFLVGIVAAVGVPYFAKATDTCAITFMGKSLYVNHNCSSDEVALKEMEKSKYHTKWEDKARENRELSDNKKEKKTNNYREDLENSRK